MADPLVEHELLLVLLDLVLHKREAYRHLLFNRPPHCALGWRGVRACLSRDVGGKGRAWIYISQHRPRRLDPTNTRPKQQLLRVAAVLLVLDTHSRYAVYAHAAAAAAAAAAGAAAAHTQNSSGSSPSHDHDIMTAAAAAAGVAGGILDQDDTPAVQLRLLLRLFLLTLLEHAAFAGLVVGGALWLFRRRDRRSAEDGALSSNSSIRSRNNDHSGGSTTQSSPSQTSDNTDPSTSYPRAALARALLQALLYPAFGRLLVPFIMVWDPAVAVAGVVGALVLSSQWQALHAVATSAPFSSSSSPSAAAAGAAASAEGAAVDSTKAPVPAAVVQASPSSSSVDAVVALPFLLGLVGRAALRLLLAGRVVALEGGGGGLGGVFSRGKGEGACG